jgi:hypothetical protein
MPFSPAISALIRCDASRRQAAHELGHLLLSTARCHYGNIAYRTGRKLHIDVKTEGFVNDAEANALLKRTYRAPWVVPERV